MTARALVVATLAAAALAGCPLPQPLPDYPPGTITPPRILVDGIAGHEQSVVLVPADCAIEPTYPILANVHDSNTLETIEARWFVNYDARFDERFTPVQFHAVPSDPNPLVLTRTVPPPDPETGAARPFVFRPYQHRPPVGAPAPPSPDPPFRAAGIVRVLELVVSNGFHSGVIAPGDGGLPFRTPLPGFETQVHRWIFLTVQEPAACASTPGEPGCCPAPAP